ncbi:hypothetical protein [Pseudoalteromonas phenolica]|nr:hypothetical protein [Pseudoalteromonas phenolica]MBE0357289.1 hypothetical protein [Pseudoalteromonas phenolica O-BC30]
MQVTNVKQSKKAPKPLMNTEDVAIKSKDASSRSLHDAKAQNPISRRI